MLGRERTLHAHLIALTVKHHLFIGVSLLV
jgi:hypothetical protein